MYRLLVALALVAPACKKDEPKVAAAPDPCAKAKQEGPLAWFEDDFPAALACAKAKQLPLVLDLWAPWCHTCLSMKTTVFQDPSFAADATKFVFVGIDTDREESAPIVAKFPLSAWPTFYVINTNEEVLARFVGAASVTQFHAFLDAGAKAVVGAEGAGKHLLAAERAIAIKDLAAAERELTAALVEAPADWVRKPDALVSLIHTKRKREDFAGCLDVAEKSMDDTGNAASATDFVGIATDCASSFKQAPPEQVLAIRTRAVARLEGLLADEKAPLSVDDRSDAMLYLRDIYDKLDTKAKAVAVAEKQLVLLEEAASRATSPLAAMTFNYQLADVCVYLGRPLDAVPALEKSATDLPHEYDPAARLGWVLLAGGKLDEATKWTDKAIALAYGPRKARMLSQRAEIANKRGNRDDEKVYRKQIVELWESLPPGQANPAALAKAKETLAKLDAPADTGSAGTGSRAGSGSSAGSSSGSGNAGSGSAGSGSGATR